MEQQEQFKSLNFIFKEIGHNDNKSLNVYSLYAGRSEVDKKKLELLLTKLYDFGYVEDNDAINCFFTDKGLAAWRELKNNDDIKLWTSVLSDLFNVSVTTDTVDIGFLDDIPVGTEVWFLPDNVLEIVESEEKPEEIYSNTSVSILKLLQQKGIKSSFSIGSPVTSSVIEKRSVEWFGPTLYITLKAIADNPELLPTIFEIISSYVKEIFKGKSSDPNMTCSFVIEKETQFEKKKSTYKGPVSGLPVMKEILNDYNR